MSNEFSLESLFKSAFPFLESSVKGSVSSAFSFFSAGPFGFLANLVPGLMDWINGLKSKAENIVNEASQKALNGIDKNLGAARAGALSATENFFTQGKTAMGVSDDLWSKLKQETLAFTTQSLKDGVPALESGYPTASYKNSIALYKSIETMLMGVGGLPVTMSADQRTAKAAALSGLITGVNGTDTEITLAGKPPTSGTAGMLAGIQKSYHASTPVEIVAEKIAMTPESASLAALASPLNASNPKKVAGDPTPPKGNKPVVATTVTPAK